MLNILITYFFFETCRVLFSTSSACAPPQRADPAQHASLAYKPNSSPRLIALSVRCWGARLANQHAGQSNTPTISKPKTTIASIHKTHWHHTHKHAPKVSSPATPGDAAAAAAAAGSHTTIQAKWQSAWRHARLGRRDGGGGSWQQLRNFRVGSQRRPAVLVCQGQRWKRNACGCRSWRRRWRWWRRILASAARRDAPGAGPEGKGWGERVFA